MSLKEENYRRYVELYESSDPSGEAPWFGWLCNRIAGYPDSLALKTRLHLQPAPARPSIELEPTDHPLAAHQREGISIPEVQELIERALHPEGSE